MDVPWGDLEVDRALLERSSTAERVAGILRTRIAEGYFAPGTRLPEDALGGALGVSRNTLREAFRLLTHERLLVHALNRGVFVRTLSVDEVTDIYRLRRVLECGAVRSVGTAWAPDLSALRDAVTAGHAAARRGDWQGLGTADIQYHRAVAALLQSPRVDEIMAGLLAELRLVFHLMADPQRFHEPYLERNTEILDVLADGDGATAGQLLDDYLDDALAQLTAALSAHQPAPS